MPYGTNYENLILTDEEAWDVAAYINSKQRPYKDISMDWPDISKNPLIIHLAHMRTALRKNGTSLGPMLP